MKYDVIVGNPPYQGDRAGHGASASPIYHLFIERAMGLSPRYLMMIVPSRWFAGGKGLDRFRECMIADRRLRKIVDHPIASDCFPGVQVTGGVNFFLWDSEHDGDCEFVTRVNHRPVSTKTRDLRLGRGVLIRDNNAGSVIERVDSCGSYLSEVVSTRHPFGQALETNFPLSVVGTISSQAPFGLRTNFPGAEPEPFPGSVPLIYNSKVGYIRPDQVTRNQDLIHRWKVLLPMAGSGEATSDPEGGLSNVVLGEPIALAPGSACTQTYLVAGHFETKTETENYAWYLCTRFVRFLVLQRKVTRHVIADRFRFVPQMDMTRRWSDNDLYEHFGLTADERAYIEKTIRPRQPNLSLDSPIPASHLPGGRKYRAPK